MKSVQCDRIASLVVGLAAILGWRGTTMAQTCEPACANSIFAPEAAQDGDTINYAYTISVQSTGVECSTAPSSARFWLPSNPPDDPNQCEATNGVELPLPAGLILDPGEFIRFSANDSGVVNCSGAITVNCEIVVPGLVYIADDADAVAGSFPFFGCWNGNALPQLREVECAAEEFTALIIPDIDIEKDSVTERVCEGTNTPVTYTYTVTTGTGNVAIENIVVDDDLCDPVVRGPDTPGNNNDILELGEVWNFSCNDTINGETTNTVSVTGTDVELGRTVTDTDILTIEGNAPPTCIATADPADICEGESSEICVAPSGDNPPFDVVIRDGSGAVIQTCIDVPVGGECCVDVGPFPTAGTFTFTAEITDDVGCVGECEADVTVHDNPVCTVSPDPAEICDGASIELCANVTGGRPPYSFLWSNGATTQCTTVSPPDDAEFCVTVTDDNGCVTECCRTVVVNDNLTVTPFGDTACEGESAQVCAAITGGREPYSVVWFNSNGQQVGSCNNIPEGGQCCLTVDTSDPGNFDFTAVATDINGCTGEADARLDVFANRLVTVIDAEICEGDPLEICATVAGGTPPYQVTWTDSGGNTIDTCTVTVDNGQCCIIVPSEGEYCAHAVDANGCEGEDCGTLTVNNADCVATATPGKICEGESAEICISPTGDRPPFTVEIYESGVLVHTCNAVPNGGQCCVSVSPDPGSYTYHAVITDAGGCEFGTPTDGECQVDLDVNENPECVISPDPAEICEGESIELCANVTGGRPPYSFLWSNGATTQCITVSPAADTLYTVTVTDDNGCETSCERFVDVHDNPECTITTTGGDCPQTLTVNVTGGRPPYSFLWSTGETTASIIVDASGDYCVTVTDDNGCVGDCCITIDCPAGEGCTPGYWKQPHHFDDWTAPFDPDDLFSDHFEDAFPGKTLLEVLSQPASSPPGPNALNNLGRHTVAALLNAAHPDVDSGFSAQEVIDLFNDVFPGTDSEYNDLKNIFAASNEQGCPLNGNSDGNADGLVNSLDLADLLSNWGGKGAGDVNQDGIVNSADLAQLLANWGA